MANVDSFQYRSRVQPALLCVLPLSLTLALVLGLSGSALSGAISFAASTGVFYFIATLVGDRGKRLQDELWSSWGAPPTTLLLRGDAEDSVEVRTRRWQLMRGIMRDGIIEIDGAAPSDGEIEVYVARLRELTRDRDQFHLIAAENAGYGFRRNTLGLRPLGICLGLVALGVAVVASLVALPAHSTQAALFGAAAVGNLIVIALWIWAVSRNWVKRQAFNYANALLGSAEVLVGDASNI